MFTKRRFLVNLAIHRFLNKNQLKNIPKISYCIETKNSVMKLHAVISTLQSIAPNHLAENWDNVGLLVQPTPPHQVAKMMLTNDLTEAVLEEAIERKANLVLSYHPPIFTPLKRLTNKNWKERIIIRCLENRIAVYSPHTALDAIPNGVNDWLISAFDATDVKPITSSHSKTTPSTFTHRVVINVPQNPQDSDIPLTEALNVLESDLQSYSKDGQLHISKVYFNSPEDKHLESLVVSCKDQVLALVVAAVSTSNLTENMEVTKLEKIPIPGHGMGRIGSFNSEMTIEMAVSRIKEHLGLNHVRLALGVGKTQESSLKTVAVCAGSGSSVLSGINADLFVTGEMSHHDVLDAVAKGSTVILCEHSNTERGYLRSLIPRLTDLLEERVEVFVSETDADPLAFA